MQEYSKMLLESAKQVYNIIQKPAMTDENKMLIASANTLAQTTKTAIQLELLALRKENSFNQANILIDRIGN